MAIVGKSEYWVKEKILEAIEDVESGKTPLYTAVDYIYKLVREAMKEETGGEKCV